MGESCSWTISASSLGQWSELQLIHVIPFLPPTHQYESVNNRFVEHNHNIYLIKIDSNFKMDLRLIKRINNNSLILSYIPVVFTFPRLSEKGLWAIDWFKFISKQDPKIAYD